VRWPRWWPLVSRRKYDECAKDAGVMADYSSFMERKYDELHAKGLEVCERLMQRGEQRDEAEQRALENKQSRDWWQEHAGEMEHLRDEARAEVARLEAEVARWRESHEIAARLLRDGHLDDGPDGYFEEFSDQQDWSEHYVAWEYLTRPLVERKAEAPDGT